MIRVLGRLRALLTHKEFIFVLALAAYSIELLRSAWLSDDIGITVRTVLNFINGFGPTFNIDERVQAYTHPLWFLLIAGSTWVTRDPFFSVFLLCTVCSVLAFALLISRIARGALSSALAASALLTSKAYIDFSTSGLENPLTNLFIVIFIALSIRASQKKEPWTIVSCCLFISLFYLTRPDLILLIAPAAAVLLVSAYGFSFRSAYTFLIGTIPAILWTLFSLFYYGFPFPNTAYAKLGSGVPHLALATQGLRYMFNSVMLDPTTLFIIVLSIFACARTRGARPYIVGIALYLLYIIYIGGDFMSGRFFVAPFVLAVALIAQESWSGRRLRIILMGLIAFGIVSLVLFFSGYWDNDIIFSQNGVADERGVYFPTQGLFTLKYPYVSWVKSDFRLTETCGGLGFMGLKDGPSTHLIDTCGLSDPLLARLPIKSGEPWRIGHFMRDIPDGYEASIGKNEDLLGNPALHPFYDAIRTVTRGPLWSSARFRDIFLLDTGLLKPPPGA